VQALAWPEVRNRLTVDGVISGVDAEAVAAGRFASDPAALSAARAADPSLDHDSPLEELFEEQVACADMIVLNKRDRVDARQLQGAEGEIARHARPAVRLLHASHGAVEPGALLGLGAAAEDDLASRPSHLDGAEAHDHDDFESFSVELPELAAPEALAERVRSVLETYQVLRVKGFASVRAKPLRLTVQAVGNRVDFYYDRPWPAAEPRSGRLVVIGLTGLPREAISRALTGT
jgi:cobalamin biosynthesis protein CobW